MNVWKRYELKERAKQVLKVNYWIALVVALILVLVSGGLGFSNSGWRAHSRIEFGPGIRWERQTKGFGDWDNDWDNQFNDGYDSFSEFLEEFPDDVEEMFDSVPIRATVPIVATIIALLVSIAGLIGLAIKIFITNPLSMGCKAFFKTSAEIPHRNMNDLGTGFRDGNYMPVVKTMFFRGLYTFLWSLLFVIPGIIKSYSYKMVPYILADNPKMGANEAITLSRRMMNGQKWKAFVLDLSFIGWYLLGTLAFGIGTVFVHPYYYSTQAQLYLTLRQKGINDGYFAPKSLDMDGTEA